MYWPTFDVFMQNLSKKIGTICISAVLVLVLNNEYRLSPPAGIVISSQADK